MADSYDSLIARAVPRYQEMTDRLAGYLPAHSARILDLGCGTGNLTLRLAADHAAAAITAVDAAPEMTALTARRMAEVGVRARLTTMTQRFEDLSFPPGSFDLVTSCISLHHVRDKADLYRRIHGWLAPGGTLRFADQLRGGTDAIHAINWARWLEFCALPGHCTAEEIRSLVEHAAAHDHYTPLQEHFELLGRAGFGDLDCVWRNWIWGIITAER